MSHTEAGKLMTLVNFADEGLLRRLAAAYEQEEDLTEAELELEDRLLSMVRYATDTEETDPRHFLATILPCLLELVSSTESAERRATTPPATVTERRYTPADPYPDC